jgi:uncharacterized protein YndB with AHSA1/START domain
MAVKELESIVLARVIPASPERIYRAWLDAKEHGAFTGGNATSDAKVGGKFTAWDDYIAGMYEALVPNEKIVQRWRSTDFPVEAAHSKVTITFAPDPGGTLLTIEHTEIPAGQGKSYEDGWVQYYFTPMKTYFAPAKKKAAPAKKKAAPAKKKAAPAKK